MPRQDPVAGLPEQLLETLRRMRHAAEFPITLRRLVELAGAATPQLVARALARKELALQCLVPFKRDLDSPVCLSEDADRLAASPLLLRHALGKACTQKRPLVTAGQLEARLPMPLRQPFTAALARHLAVGPLPEGVGFLASPGDGHWYLTAFLPPQSLLAARLLNGLAQWQKEGTNYPPTLRQLAARVDPAAARELVSSAVAEKCFKTQALFALAKITDGPVALAEDRARLLDSPDLLADALAAACRPDDQAVSPAAVVKKLARPLQADFAARLRHMLDVGHLAPGVGCLRIKKKPHLFLLSELAGDLDAPRGVQLPIASWPTVDSPGSPRVGDFVTLFDEAFSRLDRAHGSHNLVSLVVLRQALAIDRPAFDAGLDHLRRSGRYVLSAAEGRHGITTDDLAAGLAEDGALLLYASRRIKSV